MCEMLEKVWKNCETVKKVWKNCGKTAKVLKKCRKSAKVKTKVWKDCKTAKNIWQKCKKWALSGLPICKIRDMPQKTKSLELNLKIIYTQISDSGNGWTLETLVHHSPGPSTSEKHIYFTFLGVGTPSYTSAWLFCPRALSETLCQFRYTFSTVFLHFFYFPEIHFFTFWIHFGWFP